MTAPSFEPNDSEQVARIRAGDERGLSVLYDRYAERLFSLAMSIVDDPGEAEEAVADAFLRLWNEQDHDESRGSVGAYLVVVTRSRALDRKRASKRRGARQEKAAATDDVGAAIPISNVGPAPDRAAELGEKRSRINTALAQLSEKQRVVIDLAYFGGLSHSEIAERLAEPLGTVKTRLRDGMNKLRDLFPDAARST